MRMSSTVATSICGSLESKFDAFTLNATSIWICWQIYTGKANEDEKKGIGIERTPPHITNPNNAPDESTESYENLSAIQSIWINYLCSHSAIRVKRLDFVITVLWDIDRFVDWMENRLEGIVHAAQTKQTESPFPMRRWWFRNSK